MFEGKRIFVTGGTGSWGHELVRQLLSEHNPASVVVYSRNEHKQVEMRREFDNPKLKFVIGDVRDGFTLRMAMKGADYVFHLAALKHVPVCEENSWEAVLTNVYGTQNVIFAAIANRVKKVVDVSTDKAVDPFNLYGVTKACGEKLMINANFNYQTETRFICIRGGNVMGTHGSVLPLFKQQLQTDNCITVTDPTMTRYLMSTREAIGLVFGAIVNSLGGEIFVMRMPATTMANIAAVMIKLFGNEQTEQIIIGSRPGEKQHEMLVSRNESPRTKILNEQYYVILPPTASTELQAKYANLPGIDHAEFTTQNARQLTNEEFIAILKKEDWLWNDGLEPNTGRAIQLTVGLTGANGFIGRHLIALASQDSQIKLVHFTGDLLQPADLDAFFQANPNLDAVIHLAGLLTGDDSAIMEVNARGTENLLAAMVKHHIPKVVFSSTGAVYRCDQPIPTNEEATPQPAGAYALSKLLAEEAIRTTAAQHNLSYVILRFPNVYGTDSDHGVIHNFLRDIKETGRVTVNGDGSQTRCFLHADDASRALMLALRHPHNDIFNIAPDRRYSLLEVLEVLRARHQFEVELAPADNPVIHLVLNASKARHLLRWQPQHEELYLNDI